MTISLSSLRTHTTLAALAIVTIAACGTNPKREANVVAADSSQRMSMTDQRMPMTEMMSSCPLGMKSLALTPSQQATFDSVRTAHRAAMQREMQEALSRARAVLTDAQRIQFDSASAAHKAMMTKMMSGSGCME